MSKDRSGGHVSIETEKRNIFSGKCINNNTEKNEIHEGYGITEWSKRHKVFIRITSLFLAILFFNQQSGWAQNGRPVWVVSKQYNATYDRIAADNIDIPYDIAETQEIVADGGDEVIINIQDAHSSLSAQYSISNLLNSLVTNYDLRFIALEGASGFVDTSLLKTYPDIEIRNKTAEALVSGGLMSAGEFFTITNDVSEVTLYGVEDSKLYQTNLESFREVAEERVVYSENLIGLHNELKNLEEKIYSEDLLALIRSSEVHREGTLSFTEYWDKISLLAGKYKASYSGYPSCLPGAGRRGYA